MIRCCNYQPPRHLPSGTKRPPRPIPKIITRKTIKEQIHLAKLVCKNFEDSYECAAAWEHVQELENRLNAIEDALKYMELEDWLVPESDVKNREYDL
jgi:CP12 domain